MNCAQAGTEKFTGETTLPAFTLRYGGIASFTYDAICAPFSIYTLAYNVWRLAGVLPIPTDPKKLGALNLTGNLADECDHTSSDDYAYGGGTTRLPPGPYVLYVPPPVPRSKGGTGVPVNWTLTITPGK